MILKEKEYNLMSLKEFCENDCIILFLMVRFLLFVMGRLLFVMGRMLFVGCRGEMNVFVVLVIDDEFLFLDFDDEVVL